MKKENKFDRLFENLQRNLSGIKNFQLLIEDPKGQEIYKLITNRIAEIHSFKSLFVNYYLPAASRSVVDDMQDLEKSKYKQVIKISKEEFKENYYETVRLGYVGMFHKFENFVDDLIAKSEILIDHEPSKDVPLATYIEKEFNYKIKNWKNSKTIERLNWICNCIKHKDGYPKKDFKPEVYVNLPINEKIKLTKEDFVRDMDLLIEYYQSIIQTVFFCAIYKMLFDEIETYADEIDEIKDLQNENISKLKGQIEAIIELSKQM